MQTDPTLFEQAAEALRKALAAEAEPDRWRLINEALRLHGMALKEEASQASNEAAPAAPRTPPADGGTT